MAVMRHGHDVPPRDHVGVRPRRRSQNAEFRSANLHLPRMSQHPEGQLAELVSSAHWRTARTPVTTARLLLPCSLDSVVMRSNAWRANPRTKIRD